ncbi:hypothetical protein Q8W71_27905 [Methylobacterium sp. NEAU 140]|uniref:hypothetical protein n=1 Tax=Methylobacterium sp. NEAU 140 TaxID=3064945 RepID=UPI002735EBC4|nr:hypothetical protein [Methylobacterium sp. NEAU 140]MDP4026450.1 hypothetical protein [Methylobacterium sp. NEAU 140]
MFFASAQWNALGAEVEHLKRENDLYGVIGTQQKRLPSRSRGGIATVRQVSGLIVDVDFASMKDTKKRYIADAAAAAAIRQALPLPPSAVVATGNGEHWHWFLDQPMVIENQDELDAAKRTTAEFSRRMQAVFREHGAEIDAVGDITRAFRLPGTFNRKGGETKPVVLLAFDPAQRYRRAQVEQFIATAAPAPHPAAKKRPSDGFGRADHGVIRRGCAWYETMTGDGAATASEPEWFAAASITACCRDGEEVFHAYSAAHPGYDRGEAQKKFEIARRNDAPRTCHSIEADLGHGGCLACPYHGRVKSPVQIGSGRRRYDPGDEGPIPLGYTRDGYFALRDPVRNIILSASAQQFLSGQWLQGVAPSEFWGRQFRSEGRPQPFQGVCAGPKSLR